MVDLNTKQLSSRIPTNTKVTIYHSSTEIINGRPKESFVSFVLDVWLETSKASIVKKYSTNSDIEAITIIPIRDLKYLSYREFKNQTGFFTVQAGRDRLVIGEVVRNVTQASDLTDDDSIETLLITDVEEVLTPRGLFSIELGLK